MTGCWFEPLWKILVNWDDDIPNIWENKIDVPNHQPDEQRVRTSLSWCQPRGDTGPQKMYEEWRDLLGQVGKQKTPK